MLQEQVRLKQISNIGVVAAFGLITMSSGITNQSLTTMHATPGYYFEANNYSFDDSTKICNSSILSKQSVGDIISVDRKSDFVQQHGKINVNLQIKKILKHVSFIDLEEEYEEI